MNALTVDFINKKIIMTRKFAKLASATNTKEYTALQTCKKQNNDFEIVVRSIRKAKNKETFKGLTYEFIEKYIAEHDCEIANMSTYNELRSRGMAYSYIRRWFLNTYPEFSKS